MFTDSDNVDSTDEENRKSSKRRSSFGPKKKPYAHTFCSDWLKNPLFSRWLRPSIKGDLFYHCALCNDDNKGGLSAVRKHLASQKHTKNVKSVKNVVPINKMLETASESGNLVKTAELRLAMFISEHNIAFRTTDHLVQLLKVLGSESQTIKNILCNRTKATKIVTNVIGATGFEQTVSKLKTQYFSLILDESTDKSSIKHLALVVRIFDKETFTVTDQFLDLIQISNATALSVFNAVVSFFNKNNIPFKENLIGFAADGANTMFGDRHSVKTLLEDAVPNIFVAKCICHSLALCASYACEKIPIEVEILVRDVYTYLKYSFKRQKEFMEFQSYIDSKPHKLLHPCQTRWLSLLSCVNRVLEQYASLTLYFQGEYLIDSKAKNIYDKLTNPIFKLYLQFLSFILPIICDLTREFQAEGSKIYILYAKMESAYKVILECYLKPKYLTDTEVSLIQYRNPNHYLPTEQIYLGGDCSAAFTTNPNILNRMEKKTFYDNCLAFYVECCHQIYKRFPFKSNYVKLLKSLTFIDPKNIKAITSVAPIASLLPKLSFNYNKLDQEWRQMRNMNLDFNLNVLDFWKYVFNLIDGNDNPVFPKLIKLVSYILTLPHSSAAVERIFSTINLNKTKTRNKLSTESLIGILHSKNMIKSEQKSCFNFSVTKEMLQKHNNSMYK